MPIPPELRKPQKRKPAVSAAQVMDAHRAVAALVEHWNQKNAVIRIGGKTVVVTEIIDPVFGRPDLIFQSVQDFKAFHANHLVAVPNGNNGTKIKNAASVWLENSARRTYEGIVFAPQKECPNYLNLWGGFAATPQRGSWSMMHAHIRDVICCGNADYHAYLMEWLADAVQNPGGERPGVAIVLRGKKGVGKGIFVSAFGRIFGQHFLHITQSDHLVGKFNAHLKNALLVFADEAFWAGDRGAEGTLKNIITENTIQIELKGKDPFPVRNHTRLIIASNEDWVVPASMDERRFFILQVADRRMQDTEYFGAIVNESLNGGIEAMMYDLLHWPLGRVNLREVPRGQAFREQVEHSMDSVGKWYLSCLHRGSQLQDAVGWDLVVPTQALYADYISYCGMIKENYPMPDFLFVKRLKAIEPRIFNARRRLNYKLVHALKFPPLRECREGNDAMMGAEMDWEPDVLDDT